MTKEMEKKCDKMVTSTKAARMMIKVGNKKCGNEDNGNKDSNDNNKGKAGEDGNR